MKPGLLTLCVALVAGAIPIQATAQTPPPPSPAARAPEPIGRLFFTPAQRASLDVARAQRARTALATEETEETVATTAAPVPQTITYDGVVRRSDGKTTVWINSRPVADKGPSPAVVGQVRPDGTVTLQLPQSGRSVELKPGQSIELLSGAIEERYARKPPAPEPEPAAKPAAAAKGATPASPEAVRAEREREEREQRRVDDAVTRALEEKAGAKPAASPAAGPEGPR